MLTNWEKSIKESTPYKGMSKEQALAYDRQPTLRGLKLMQLEQILRETIGRLFSTENPPSIADREALLTTQRDILHLQSLHLGQDPSVMPGDASNIAAVGARNGMNFYSSQLKPTTDYERMRISLTDRDNSYKSTIKYKTGDAKSAATKAHEQQTADDRSALAAHDKSKAYFKQLAETKERKMELLGKQGRTKSESAELAAINLSEARGA